MKYLKYFESYDFNIYKELISFNITDKKMNLSEDDIMDMLASYSDSYKVVLEKGYYEDLTSIYQNHNNDNPIFFPDIEYNLGYTITFSRDIPDIFDPNDLKTTIGIISNLEEIEVYYTIDWNQSKKRKDFDNFFNNPKNNNHYILHIVETSKSYSYSSNDLFNHLNIDFETDDVGNLYLTIVGSDLDSIYPIDEKIFNYEEIDYISSNIDLYNDISKENIDLLSKIIDLKYPEISSRDLSIKSIIYDFRDDGYDIIDGYNDIITSEYDEAVIKRQMEVIDKYLSMYCKKYEYSYDDNFSDFLYKIYYDPKWLSYIAYENGTDDLVDYLSGFSSIYDIMEEYLGNVGHIRMDFSLYDNIHPEYSELNDKINTYLKSELAKITK